MADNKLKVTLIHSAQCNTKADQTKTARALGLKKIGDTAELPDNPSIRGMLFKIKHLVLVEEASTNKKN